MTFSQSAVSSSALGALEGKFVVIVVLEVRDATLRLGKYTVITPEGDLTGLNVTLYSIVKGRSHLFFFVHL